MTTPKVRFGPLVNGSAGGPAETAPHGPDPCAAETRALSRRAATAEAGPAPEGEWEGPTAGGAAKSPAVPERRRIPTRSNEPSAPRAKGEPPVRNGAPNGGKVAAAFDRSGSGRARRVAVDAVIRWA